GDRLHPGADQRDELPRPEEPEVAVRERAQRDGQGGWRGDGHRDSLPTSAQSATASGRASRRRRCSVSTKTPRPSAAASAEARKPIGKPRDSTRKATTGEPMATPTSQAP